MPETEHRLVRLVTKHPVLVTIGFIGAVASILGLPPTWFPWLTLPRPHITWTIDFPLVSKAHTDYPKDVSISYKGIPVSGDVTQAKIRIQNDGREISKGEEVLKPVTISTGKDHPILEATLIHVDSELCGVNLDTNGMASGVIGLRWKELDHKEGADIQIVYDGPGYVPISIEGGLSGQKDISKAEVRPVSSGAKALILRVVAWGSVVIFFFSLFVAVRRSRKYPYKVGAYKWVLIFSLLITIFSFFGSNIFFERQRLEDNARRPPDDTWDGVL